MNKGFVDSIHLEYYICSCTPGLKKELKSVFPQLSAQEFNILITIKNSKLD